MNSLTEDIQSGMKLNESRIKQMAANGIIMITVISYMEWEQDISMFDWFFTPNNDYNSNYMTIIYKYKFML